jgi:hypothetical protein
LPEKKRKLENADVVSDRMNRRFVGHHPPRNEKITSLLQRISCDRSLSSAARSGGECATNREHLANPFTGLGES